MTDSPLEKSFLYQSAVDVLEGIVDARRVLDLRWLNVPKMDSKEVSEESLMAATLVVGHTDSSSNSVGHGRQAL